MTEHTPGPWAVEGTTDFGAAFRVVDVQDVTVALCYQQPLDTWTAEANARLITAAPELLELIKVVKRHRDDPYGQAIRAVILKAEGDTE